MKVRLPRSCDPDGAWERPEWGQQHPEPWDGTSDRFGSRGGLQAGYQAFGFAPLETRNPPATEGEIGLIKATRGRDVMNWQGQRAAAALLEINTCCKVGLSAGSWRRSRTSSNPLIRVFHSPLNPRGGKACNRADRRWPTVERLRGRLRSRPAGVWGCQSCRGCPCNNALPACS
jgi:hypothetical protein